MGRRPSFALVGPPKMPDSRPEPRPRGGYAGLVDRLPGTPPGTRRSCSRSRRARKRRDRDQFTSIAVETAAEGQAFWLRASSPSKTSSIVARAIPGRPLRPLSEGHQRIGALATAACSEHAPARRGYLKRPSSPTTRTPSARSAEAIVSPRNPWKPCRLGNEKTAPDASSTRPRPEVYTAFPSATQPARAHR